MIGDTWVPGTFAGQDGGCPNAKPGTYGRQSCACAVVLSPATRAVPCPTCGCRETH